MYNIRTCMYRVHEIRIILYIVLDNTIFHVLCRRVASRLGRRALRKMHARLLLV